MNINEPFMNINDAGTVGSLSLASAGNLYYNIINTSLMYELCPKSDLRSQHT